MTNKGKQTRQLIIQEATHLFTRNGYRSTSLSQILRSTGLAKGGFYFHFRSKEELGKAVLRYLESCWTEEILPSMAVGRDAKEKLEMIIAAPGDCRNRDGVRPTILLLNLATEMIEVNDSFLQILRQIFNGWWIVIKAVIEEGKIEGIFRADVDTGAVAAIILSNIMGANLLALLNDSPAIYETQLRTLGTVLFQGIAKSTKQTPYSQRREK